MKFIELITEGEQDALERDLIDLLIAAKASGIDEMETETLVDQLSDMGHSITVNSLLSLYDEDRPDIIQNITSSVVSLDVQDSGEYSDETDTQEDFEHDTSKQAMKNIKARANKTKKLGKDLR